MTAMVPTSGHAEAVMRISHLVVLLAGTVVVMLPSAAKAEISYTFIKMTCDPASQSATIKAFYSEDENADSHDKDTYSLDKIGATTPQKYGKKITCDLGNGETVAFATHEGDVPKKDGLKLFFDQAKYHHASDRWGGYGLGDGGFTLNIKMTSVGEYALKYCPEDIFQLDSLGAERIEELAEKHEKKCEVTHVSQGLIVGHGEIVDP